MKKAVAIVSGGIDSTTLLYKLVQDGYDVHALTVLYGQKHEREVESAKKITGLLNMSVRAWMFLAPFLNVFTLSCCRT